MATKTSNYEFNKPEQNDFYDVDVQNENWDKVDEELSEFDDSGVTEDIKSFPDFLSKFVTGNKVAITLRNLKAGLQFVLHAGQIVNNCVTDNTGLPLSAAQGKVLKDLIDTTNNNLSKVNPTKQYVSNVDVVTTIRALTDKGESCGNILFAGDSNIGLPTGYTSGAVEYYIPNGSSIIYLKFSNDKASFNGFINRSATTPTWTATATKDDLKKNAPTRYGIINIPAQKTCKIMFTSSEQFLTLIGCQGNAGNLFGTFLVSGYGEGGTSRYHVSDLNSSGVSSDITCTAGTNGTYSVLVKNNDTMNRSAEMVITEFFNKNSFTTQII